MRATVIVRLNRIRDDVARRKAIVKFDGFLINGQVKSRGKALARRHVSQTISTAYNEIYITQQHSFPQQLEDLSRVFRYGTPSVLLPYFRPCLSDDIKGLQCSKWPCVSYSRELSFPQALRVGYLADKTSCSELDMSNGTLEFYHYFIFIS